MADTTSLGDDLLAILNDSNLVIVARLAKAVTADFTQVPVDLANLVEADFPGYSPKTTFDWQIVQDDGETVQALSDVLQFEASDDIVNPQAIVGVFYTKSYAGEDADLFHFEPLEQPFVLKVPGDSLLRQLRVEYAQSPDDLGVGVLPSPIIP